MSQRIRSMVGGSEVPGAPGGRLRCVNPARSSELVAEVELGGADTFVAAARAARSAQAWWADVPEAFRFRRGVSAGMVSINNSTSGAEAHLPFGGNGKSGNGSRQSGIWVLDQFTRWQSINWDYSGSLQKAQMDVAELTTDDSFRLTDGQSTW